MNQSLWPVALVGGIVCTYLPVGLADTVTSSGPVVVAAASAPGPAKPDTPIRTTTTRLPTSEEVRAALERGVDRAAAAGRRVGEAMKGEVQRFEREHPAATRPTTTTISTGDPKAPLVIRQQAASQP